MWCKAGFILVRCSTQTELHKRIYADTCVMAFILLRRSRRVCRPYADIRNSGLRTIPRRWIYFICRKSLRIRRGRGLLANDNPASTRKSRRIVGVFILGICAIRALGIKNRIIRYSIFHSILDTCISPKYRLSGQRFIRYSIHRSIMIPPSIDIERSQVSRYLDI